MKTAPVNKKPYKNQKSRRSPIHDGLTETDNMDLNENQNDSNGIISDVIRNDKETFA